MASYWNLLKREYFLSQNMIIWKLVLLVGAGVLGVYLAYRYHRGIELVLALGTILSHILFLALYLLRSLSSEWKDNTQPRPPGPQSGWNLLGTKLIVGMLSLLSSLGLAYIFTFWIAVIDLNNFPLIWSVTIKYGFWVTLEIMFLALYIGLWATLIYIIVIASKSFIKKGNAIIGFLVLLIPTWGMSILRNSRLYDQLVRWGPIYFNFDHIHQDLHRFQVPLYIGQGIFYTLMMVGIFYLAGWLLDNKVNKC